MDKRIWYTVLQNQAPAWQSQQTRHQRRPDNVQCPAATCSLITAHIAWEGPQEQTEYVYGTY